MHAFNVRLNGKTIDTVFATEAGTIPKRELADRMYSFLAGVDTVKHGNTD